MCVSPSMHIYNQDTHESAHKNYFLQIMGEEVNVVTK